MIALLLCTASFTAQDSQPPVQAPVPKFGAFVEEITLFPEREFLDPRTSSRQKFVSYDSAGRLWTPDTQTVFTQYAKARVCAPNETAYCTFPNDDRVEIRGNTGAADKAVYFGGRGVERENLCQPAGLTIDPRGKGSVLVADTLNHRVSIFDLTGDARATMGRFGSGDGELNHPNDVAVDSIGNAFVADVGNDRIVKFDADGKFVKSFGGRGSYPGLFRAPMGVDVHGQRLYVADRDNHRVQVFDLEGEFIYEWGVSALLPREGKGKLHDPSDVAVSPKGDRVAVIEPNEGRIQVFGPAREDTILTTSESDSGTHPAGFPSVRCDVFAVADPTGPSVSIFDLSFGTPIEITKFGRPGQGPGRMLRPVSVLLDAKAEHVFVADPFAYTISVFDITRRPDEPLRFDPFLARFERAVDLRSQGEASRPWPIEPAGMCLSPEGHLLVVDQANLRVVEFAEDFTLVKTIELFSDVDPYGIAVNPRANKLMVSFDCCDTRTRHPQPESDVVQYEDGFAAAMNSRGVVFKSRTDLYAVLRGNAWTTPSAGIGRNKFWKPEGLVIDERDRIYVIDSGNHRIQILDSDNQYLDMFGARFYTEAARNPPPPIRESMPWDGAKSVRTKAASWRIAWKPKKGPIARGEPLTLDAWVFRPGHPTEPVSDVDLRLDAYMPDHLHGMNRVPKVSKRDDGGFTIEGVLLHMSGFWELDFDVTSKGVTERATTRIDLE